MLVVGVILLVSGGWIALSADERIHSDPRNALEAAGLLNPEVERRAEAILRKQYEEQGTAPPYVDLEKERGGQATGMIVVYVGSGFIVTALAIAAWRKGIVT
jgi:hypothetical protein